MTATQKILVVDDRRENLVALAATLRETSAEVVKAQSGNEALVASLNHDFALAIVDVQMPEMDGYELAEHMRGDERTRHVPIMFVTAYADERQMFKEYGIGAVDYIVKPYDHVVLLSKVLAFLELDRRRMEIEERSRRLEEVVDERTGELRRVNERLVREIADRKNAEQEVRDLNEHLEELVRQRTAQLETVNTELEAFAYSVSHDLRAPLRAVEGFSQALLEDYADVLDDQGRDYLGRVSTEARRMAALIHDLLVLSRVTRATMSWEHVDLGATALRVVDGLRAGGEERSVDVRVEDGLEARGDPRLLGQAMENLVGNAWKFTSRTEGARIEVGSETRGGEHVYFVRDNGAGFDMEYAGKLFTPFQRLHAMHEFSGTGVGLSIVQRIVRRHGGRVWAEGVEGEGATFFFTLGDRPARTENTPGGRRPSDAPEGEP